MRKISLIAASLLFASTLAAENDFHKAVISGTVSGDVTLYGEKQNNDSGADAGFTMGSIGLGYETGDFNGFKAAVGFRGNHDFSEVEDGDYSNDEDTKTILHTANISYANEYIGLTVGRQEIDLEWMGDFHEAVVLGVTAIPDTSVILAYTNRIAAADADAPLANFSKFNDDDGAYVLDVKYEGIKGLVVNPYYYNADNIASWYGLKADYDTDMFGVTGHVALSSEDTSSDDGQIIHLEARTNVAGIDISAGYITTDEDAGVASMAELGDNIDPTEEIGDQVYSADSDTFYLSLGTEVSGIELGAMYAQSDYGNDEAKEINLSADYGINDNLSVGALFVDVNDDTAGDFNKIALTLEYSF